MSCSYVIPSSVKLPQVDRRSECPLSCFRVTTWPNQRISLGSHCSPAPAGPACWSPPVSRHTPWLKVLSHSTDGAPLGASHSPQDPWNARCCILSVLTPSWVDSMPVRMRGFFCKHSSDLGLQTAEPRSSRNRWCCVGSMPTRGWPWVVPRFLRTSPMSCPQD